MRSHPLSRLGASRELPMKTFLLVAVLTLAGQSEEYVIDHNLTYEDCQAAKDSGITFEGPPLRHLQGAKLECEPDQEK